MKIINIPEKFNTQVSNIIFIYIFPIKVWINLFINPFKIIPNMVRKYDRLDMSQFWSWLSENKENLDKKKILTTIRTYKQKIDALNKLFNLNINDFLYN